MELDRSPHSRQARGTSLLVQHCATFGRITQDSGASPRIRLERELGGELARRLLDALAVSNPRRPPLLGI